MTQEIKEAICTFCDEVIPKEDYYSHTESHYLAGLLFPEDKKIE